MKISNIQTESGKLSFSLEHDGTGQDFFDMQAMLLRELLQQRATLQALSHLLMDLVAEVRHEDLIDVESRFENQQKDYLQKMAAILKKNQSEA